jgi:hypothetical protein
MVCRAVVIDAAASFFWPVVIGFWLGRRAKARRDDSIEWEVDRHLTERAKQDSGDRPSRRDLD